MKAIDLEPSHFLMDRRVANNFRQLLLELVDIPCYIPNDCSLLLASHFVLGVDRQVVLVSPFNFEGQIFERLQRLVHMEILVLVEEIVGCSSLLFVHGFLRFQLVKFEF